MLARAREWMQSSSGKKVAAVAAIVLVAIGLWSISGQFGGGDVAEMTRAPWFIDSTTMKPFRHTLVIGEKSPVKAPSGQMTGYQAEMCGWATDGSIKDEPTPVLLNESIGKNGPTFCPDCKRLVIGQNPGPSPNGKAPPTEAEHASRRPAATPAE